MSAGLRLVGAQYWRGQETYPFPLHLQFARQKREETVNTHALSLTHTDTDPPPPTHTKLRHRIQKRQKKNIRHIGEPSRLFDVIY